MRLARDLVLAAALAAGALIPGRVVAQTQANEPPGPDTVVYTPSRGKVTLTHGAHSRAFECSSCHHESRAEKPSTSPRQKCGSCHTEPATAPMKTRLKLAFHNTATREGTCYTCHRKQAEAGKTAPTACMDCHQRED